MKDDVLSSVETESSLKVSPDDTTRHVALPNVMHSQSSYRIHVIWIFA